MGWGALGAEDWRDARGEAAVGGASLLTSLMYLTTFSRCRSLMIGCADADEGRGRSKYWGSGAFWLATSASSCTLTSASACSVARRRFPGEDGAGAADAMRQREKSAASRSPRPDTAAWWAES